MTFEDFRQWALDGSRGAALRWEEPDDDEVQVLLAADDYDAYRVIPVPPLYLQLERGHVHWLAGALPDTSSRALKLPPDSVSVGRARRPIAVSKRDRAA